MVDCCLLMRSWSAHVLGFVLRCTRRKGCHLKTFTGDAAGGKSFQQAVPLKPDPINTVLNQTTAYANIISNAHVDPIPTNLVRFLIENPLGPQLDAAFKALPSITVRSSACPTPMPWHWPSLWIDCLWKPCLGCAQAAHARFSLCCAAPCLLPHLYRACDTAGTKER